MSYGNNTFRVSKKKSGGRGKGKGQRARKLRNQRALANHSNGDKLYLGGDELLLRRRRSL